MIRLYESSGSSEIQLLDRSFPMPEWDRLRSVAVRLLERRGAYQAAELLRKYPFFLHEGTNGFGDEFQVLYMQAPLATYVEIAEMAEDPQIRYQFQVIAKTMTEVGGYVRFIAVELDTAEGPEPVTLSTH